MLKIRQDKRVINKAIYLALGINLEGHVVLQCNVDNIPSASVDYAVNALQNGGFPVTSVVAPWRYSRPFVIGTKQ